MNKTAELTYWIKERYLMKMRKIGRECGSSWTYKHGYSDDPHMGLVRYCNVHREDDKVTKWLATHWRPKHHEVWEIVLARMVNYIPSLEVLLPLLKCPSPTRETATFLKARRTHGEKIFTSAYTISTCGQAMDKVDYVVEVVSNAMIRGEHAYNTLQMYHASLMQIKGLGSFLAAQVVADLKNTADHPLQAAPDRYTWAAPGPGSLKGLSEFFGENITPSGFKTSIETCYREVSPRLPDFIPVIDMQDFQNCLCEFSKYERVKRGGHVRNKYRAR